MLFEKNIHGASLDASDIQSSGTGLKTCQAVWGRICECSLSLSQHLSQHPAWFWEAPGAFPGTAAFLLLILALTPAQSYWGNYYWVFFFILSAEPRENQSQTPGNFKISYSQSEKDSQSFLFSSPSLTQGYKNSLQIQIEEQTNTLKTKMFLFWLFWSGTTWLHILRWTLVP